MPQEKIKTKQDQALIKKLLAFGPDDWARYPDGTLAFISPSGQKYAYTEADLEAIEKDLKPATKPNPAAAKKKPAAKKIK